LDGLAAGGIVVHDFSGQLGEQLVHFHAMRLRDSLFLWVGAAPALASLAVAMCSPRPARPKNRYLSATTFKTQTAISACS
uniref:Proteasome assembly chaperone 4 n=1 Tax=Nothoprocta perdicaria TaxID=30464 RepID=A0A8C6ZI95_NOTPE